MKLFYSLVILAAGLHALPAFAQTEKSRADVKAETKAAVKSGAAPVLDDDMTPTQGTASKSASGVAGKSTMSKKRAKAATVAASG